MLTALALTLLLLLVLAPVAALRPGGRTATLVHGGVLAAGAVFALSGLLALAGGGTGPVALPVGPPWAPLTLALDGLSAWFLLLLGLAAIPSALSALAHAAAAPARVLAGYPVFLAGMALTLLAADGLTLLLGFEAMSLASWALVAADHGRAENRRAARLYLVFAAFSAVCLVPAVGLLAGTGGELGFAAMREAPPEGWRAAAVLVLVVAGAGAKAGLAPLHAWLPLAHPAAPPHVSALMSAAMVKVALYVAARLLLDVTGPAQPLWWGMPLVLLGAASAVLGALRANLEEDGKAVLACSTVEHVGLIAVGLGLAAVFRAADLGALAALAAGAALLHAMAHALFKTALFLGFGEVARGAASRALDRLGGLARPMPWTAGAVLVAALAAAGLPPLSGFAGEWLLVQALLAAPRVGELSVQVLGVAAAACVALSVALGAAAMVRLFGLAFLGRPRTPRAAGAEELGGTARAALLLPAGLTVLLGLLPGPALRLAEDALARLTGSGMAGRAGPLSLGVGDGAAAYAPLGVALLLGAAGAAWWWGVRRHAPAGVARGPAWDGGYAAPPDHLPFGEPETQPSAAGFGQPLRRILGRLVGARERVTMPPPGDPSPARLEAGFADPTLRRLLAPLAAARDALSARAERLRGLTIRQSLMLPFGALVLGLALIAWLEAGG